MATNASRQVRQQGPRRGDIAAITAAKQISELTEEERRRAEEMSMITRQREVVEEGGTFDLEGNLVDPPEGYDPSLDEPVLEDDPRVAPEHPGAVVVQDSVKVVSASATGRKRKVRVVGEDIENMTYGKSQDGTLNTFSLKAGRQYDVSADLADYLVEKRIAVYS